jgi:hypothetical protein
MLYFGYCEQVHLGEIYRKVTATGKILIVVSVVGGIRAYGKDFWKN